MMNLTENIKALRCRKDVNADCDKCQYHVMFENRHYCITKQFGRDAADLIEYLQAQLEKSEKGRLEGVELYNKYIVLCHEKSKRLHELEAQLAETRLERNAQEANKNYYKAQLDERDRVRQKGATE